MKFGADQIISGNRGAYTDEDIDALIAKGEKKTELILAKMQKDAQHNLASFTLSGDFEATSKNTFDFGGENYRKDKNSKESAGNFINIGTRERKRTIYDVNEYFRKAMNTNSGTSSGMKAHAAEAAARKKRRVHMQEFQLYDRIRMDELEKRERELAQQKEDHLEMIRELRQRAASAQSLSNARAAIAPEASKEELTRQGADMEGMLDKGGGAAPSYVTSPTTATCSPLKADCPDVTRAKVEKLFSVIFFVNFF